MTTNSISVAGTSLAAPPLPEQDWDAVLQDPRRLANLLGNRSIVSYGAFGMVYEVADTALKIGCIGKSEPLIQQWVHENYQRALPVWAFEQEVALPKAVTYEVCPRHGYLADLWSPTSVTCHCGDSLAVLVMPLAEPTGQLDVGNETFQDEVHEAVLTKFGVRLDVHNGNFVKFDGRLMLCDFGDPNDPIVDYW